MPRLFLASSIDQTIKLLPDLAKIKASNTKVIFIADAADPYKDAGEDIFWVENEKKAFLDQGFEVIETSLEDFNTAGEKILKQVQDDRSASQDDKNGVQKETTQINTNYKTSIIIHFCGGHTLYLLHKIRKCNLVATIQNLVLSDQVVYTGSSAGSMIVAPDLSIKKDLNDEPETWVKYLSDFSDYKGLNLVDFLIIPHFNNAAYIPYNQEYVANSSFNTPLLFLSDNQAVWVENHSFRIVKI